MPRSALRSAHPGSESAARSRPVRTIFGGAATPRKPRGNPQSPREEEPRCRRRRGGSDTRCGARNRLAQQFSIGSPGPHSPRVAYSGSGVSPDAHPAMRNPPAVCWDRGGCLSRGGAKVRALVRPPPNQRLRHETGGALRPAARLPGRFDGDSRPIRCLGFVQGLTGQRRPPHRRTASILDPGPIFGGDRLLRHLPDQGKHMLSRIHELRARLDRPDIPSLRLL